MGKQLARVAAKPRQLELPHTPTYMGNLSYFLTFSQAINQGLCREVGITAFGVWIVLRAHANLQTGKVFLSLRDIHEITGLAVGTIRTAIDRLATHRLLEIVSEGPQRRRYFVLDLLSFKMVENSDPVAAADELEGGQPDRQLAVRYVPARASSDRREIEHWMATGASPQTPNVLVQVNNHNHFNGPVQIFNGDAAAAATAALSAEQQAVEADFDRELARPDLSPESRRVLERSRETMRSRWRTTFSDGKAVS